MRKILVTGGCGFIGSNFVLHLLRTRKDLQVVNLDKLTYAGNLVNLSEIEGDPRHRFVHGDICDEALVARLLADGVDSVVNFAAETHVDRSIQDSAPFILTNVGGTHALLVAARKCKVRKFIQVGTDEVYGSLGPSGLFTEDSPLQPNNPYSASKAGADLLVRAFQRTYGMDATITRCTNNYGPFQFPEKAIPVFIGNALADRPIPVYGDGLHVRDWLFVEDHCRAIEAVMERGRAGEVYNVGGANELPNIELARLILRELKKPESLIQFVKDRPGHDRRYALDSSKLSRELGWKPLVSLAEGIPRTVRWYCEHQDWLRRVQTGEYQEYYRKHYHERHGLQE
ncbi:MAG: dTDP-glucose 4,6-dehydratase [Candidatus Brocadiia bacterium]